MSDPGWVPFVSVAALLLAGGNTAVTLRDRAAKRQAVAIDEWRPFLTDLRDRALRLRREPDATEEDRAAFVAVEQRVRELSQRTNDEKLLGLTRWLSGAALRVSSASAFAQMKLVPPKELQEFRHDAREAARALEEHAEAALARLGAIERARG